MKSIHSLFIISFLALGLASCTKEKSTMASDVAVSNLVAGEWKVTYLFRDSIDHTVEFNNYTLVYDPNGTLTGANSLYAVHGDWSVSEVQTVTSLTMSFHTAHTGADVFDEIAGTWVIETNSQERMVLHQGDDYMYLERVK